MDEGRRGRGNVLLLPLALAVTNEVTSELKGCSPSARSERNLGLLIDSKLTFTNQTAGFTGIRSQGCRMLPSKEMYSHCSNRRVAGWCWRGI